MIYCCCSCKSCLLTFWAYEGWLALELARPPSCPLADWEKGGPAPTTLLQAPLGMAPLKLLRSELGGG